MPDEDFITRCDQQPISEADQKAYEDYGIIKTWKWKLPNGPFPAPEQLKPREYYCYHCENGKKHPLDYLVPYDFEGKTVYVCRSCGNVYEIDLSPNIYRSHFLNWKTLWSQPYYHNYFSDQKETLARDFIDLRGNITGHPFLDAHCKGDKRDTAETIVRFLIRVFDEKLYKPFFLNVPNGSRTEWSDGELKISDGIAGGVFPENAFRIFREGKDLFSLEMSLIRHENIFGFTCDVNSEDWEVHAFHTLCSLTFIGDDARDLPENIELIRRLPKVSYATRCWSRPVKGILKDPFGLDGYFLYENRIDHLLLGTVDDLNSDDEEEDEA